MQHFKKENGLFMNKMKQITAFLLCIGMFGACTDLEPDEVDSQVIVTDASGSTNVDPATALEGSYKALGTFADQAGIYSLTEHTSDELIPPTRGVDWSDNGVWRSLYTHTWDPSHSYINNAWNSLNQNAYVTQTVLEASGVTPQQAAEAKFLRAFNRYYVIDFWGVLPDRKTSEGVKVNPKVLTRTEGVAVIEQDLIEALAALPTVTAGPVPQPLASKAAAHAMLSRLYLNKAVYTSATPEGPYTFDPADMAKVIEHASAVMADGYALNTNYFDNFKGSGPSTEVILTAADGSPQNRVYMTLHYNQNPSGWNGFATLADFYAKFEDNDKRKGIPAGTIPGLPFGTDAKDCTTCPHKFAGIGLGFLEGQQYNDDGTPITDTRTGLPLKFSADVPLSGAATNKGIRVMKYHPAFYSRYVLLRFGEVYLNMVEAKVRGGTHASSSTTALQDINALRALRGATPLAAVTLNDILDERGRELYWEGLRRTDLIRFQKFNDNWSEKGTNSDAFRVLYSIPQLAIDTNPNLTQNPGYEGN
jgi:starch-binding outer membrane protein, SusD/RagB family